MPAATTIEKQHTNFSLLQEIINLGGEMTVEGLSHEHFCFLVGKFPELRMEQEKNGNITITAPIAGFGGARENRLGARLFIWQEQFGKGISLGSNTGFILPNGATKSPDAVWINDQKFQQLKEATDEQGFLKIVPDFVIELRSSSDRLPTLKTKMKETWMANGVQLGWLIDPYREEAYIYRNDGTVEIIEGFDNTLSGDNILPGFELKLAEFRLIAGR